MKKKEANVNEVRDNLAEYLSDAEKGNETVIKRYSKKIARIVPYETSEKKKLPDLSEFRNSLGVSLDKPAGEIIRQMRDEER